jgi:2-methylcitrate dehydratase PrpD
VRELRSRGLSAANLQHMTVRMSNKGHINIGWSYKPGEIITAQMNGFYAAAVTLLDGDAFIDQYAEARLADPAILALIPRISIVHDAELDREGPSKRHAVRIEAVRTDGTILTTCTEQRRGSAEHPRTVDEVEQKFRRLAGDVLPARSINAVLEMVAGLEWNSDIGGLTSLVTSAASGG